MQNDLKGRVNYLPFVYSEAAVLLFPLLAGEGCPKDGVR